MTDDLRHPHPRHVLSQDAFTRGHLLAWLRQYVHEDDRQAVYDGILKLLDDHPELIEKGYSWPEMRRMAEA